MLFYQLKRLPWPECICLDLYYNCIITVSIGMIVVDSRLPLLLGSAATSLSCSLFCFENQMYS